MPAQRDYGRNRRWLTSASLAALLISDPASRTPAAPLQMEQSADRGVLASDRQASGQGQPIKADTPSCPAASRRAPLTSPGPLLHRPLESPPAPALGAEASAVTKGEGSLSPTTRSDYRQFLATTALGWARLDRWCLWIEPASGDPAGRLWEQRWQAALGRAIGHWQQVLPIQLVDDPSAAQILVWRRRPPLSIEADGRRRASHGRATLSLGHVTRAGITRLEPAVEVLLSPAQRELAIEATALHELGHAFGLWGHSDQPADAMASVPGAAPVLELSPRDRATLEWLSRQPSRIGETIAP